MLSPFAIKLGEQIAGEKGLGHLTGAIFFWSTTGSIAGSLMTGFVFIPYFGVKAIMLGTTFFILILGGSGMMLADPRSFKDRIASLIFLTIAIVSSFMISDHYRQPNIVYQKDGVYEQLTVIEDYYAGRPARFFLQDKSTSGAIYVNGDDHVFPYTEYYSLYKLWKPELKSALFIGAGIYTMPRSLHLERPEATIDVIEIEPSLEDLAKEYFRLPETPNILTHITDGRRFLADSTIKYDLISSDVYFSLFSIPAHFTTLEFFQTAHEKLNDGGIFFANIIGDSSPEEPSLLYSEIRTMQEVFEHVYAFAVDGTTTTKVQNFIVVGVKGDHPLDLSSMLLSSRSEPVLRNLANQQLPLAGQDLSRFDIMTDDHAPIEHMVTRFLKPRKELGGGATASKEQFIGPPAMARIIEIVAFGPRAAGSRENAAHRELIKSELSAFGIEVATDEWSHSKADGTSIELGNIIGRIRPELERRIIIGTHHDSIIRAYRDSSNPNAPMPGANNGASGVAVLLEVAKLLSSMKDRLPYGIDIVFFDAEEGENALGAGDPAMIPLGSKRFAERLDSVYPSSRPEEAIIVDMVCDRDLEFLQEAYSLGSAKELVSRFWEIGRTIAPDAFPKKRGLAIGDDQVALIQAGIPSFLVIDFDYEPYWNTTEDTPDKCSPESLETIGRTLLAYILIRQ
jgi:spermidine synthase